MHVKGLGSGEANEGTFLDFIGSDLMDLKEDNDIGEAIEEDVIFIVGNGSGVENQVGNPEKKPSSDKPMFFFGQAGCLKLSPIKHPNLAKLDNNIENNMKTTSLFKDGSTVVDGGQSSTGLTDLPPNSETVTMDTEFEKTSENDVDVVKVSQTPNIGVDNTSTNESISNVDNLHEKNENQNAENVSTSDEKEVITPNKIEPDTAITNIEDTISTVDKASAFNIPSNANPNTTCVEIEIKKPIESIEEPPPSTQTKATSPESIIQDAGENSIVLKDENTAISDDATPLDVTTATVERVNKPSPSSSINVNEPIQISSESPVLLQPSEDSESSNVAPIFTTHINKDIDTVPESKTENLIESESAVKSGEIINVSNDDLVFPKQSTVTEDLKSDSSLNTEITVDKADSTLIENPFVNLLDKPEINQSLDAFDDAGKDSVSQEKISTSIEPLETNSCDSKVDSLIIDSRSCEDYAQRGAQLTLSPSPTAIDIKQNEIQSNQVTADTTINKSEAYQHQTSESTTETDNANCESTLNISAPENFSTLTATNQSDEIVSEPVIDPSTPDVTSMSLPSFDDQDNVTSGSMVDDQIESIETPADISVKEIGKFQIFNRKVGEEHTKTISEHNDEPSSCLSKLQYDGSEEAKTPLVLTQPTISEVPPTESKQIPIDIIKESKSKESPSSSNLMQTSTDKSELLNALQIKSSGEQTAINQEPLIQFPISFMNTQINNRKRPLSSKSDFDSDVESSSETSEEEVEVKRQKTKPKFSHLAARKNAEIKRKATQIDCSTDEDEPIHKVQLKIITTEISKVEAKQRKNEIEKGPINLMEENSAKCLSNQIIVSKASVAEVKPSVANDVLFSNEKLNPLRVTAPSIESKIVPSVEESTTKLESKDRSENATQDANSILILGANLSKKSSESSTDVQKTQHEKSKSLDEIQTPEEIKSKVEIKPKEETKPRGEIKLKEEIETKQEIKAKCEIKSSEETKANEETTTKEIGLKDEIKGRNEKKSIEEIKSNEEVKPKEGIESMQEIPSKDKVILKEEINTKDELQSNEEIKSREDIKLLEETKSKEDIESKDENNSNAEVKITEEIKAKQESKTTEELNKPATKLQEAATIKEVADPIPKEEVSLEPLKSETQRSRPGPRSKKPGLIPVPATSVDTAEIITQKQDDVVKGKFYFVL